MWSACLLLAALAPRLDAHRGSPRGVGRWRRHGRVLASAAEDLTGDGGCWMRTVRAAMPLAKKVGVGSVVTVHYSASLADGTLLSDSRNSEPLEIRVGVQPSDAVLAWDIALPRMSVGEIAHIKCSPAYAYGEDGAPPLIPPHAEMQFELEVLSARSLQDSHNPEEVDFLSKYNELVEKRSQRNKASNPPVDETLSEAKQTSTPNSDHSQKRTSARGALNDTEITTVSDAGETTSRAAPPPGWRPDRVEINGEHPSGYSWRENDELIEVVFTLPSTASKNQISFVLQTSHLELSYDDQLLLSGQLAGRVDIDGSTWIFEPAEGLDTYPKLVLSFAKRDRTLWGYVLMEERQKAEQEDGPAPKDGPADGSEPLASSLQRPGVDW